MNRLLKLCKIFKLYMHFYNGFILSFLENSSKISFKLQILVYFLNAMSKAKYLYPKNVIVL
jgi:hypothetical protein